MVFDHPPRNLRRLPLVFTCVLLFLLLFLSVSPPAAFAAPDYYRIVVLGDPHLPYKPALWDKQSRQDKVMAAKDRLLSQVNAWDDVDLVVAIGDITGGFGLQDEYDYAKKYFAKLRHPYTAVTGNHDYIFADHWSPGSHWPWGGAKTRQKKLDRFRELFGLTELYQTRRAGPCLLIFLSADMTAGNPYQTQISENQLDWFRAQLAANPDVPTIIFNHAPLKGTLSDEFKRANTDQEIAQPHEALREIIRRNPQILLWVSGHLHVPATNENFKSPVNLFEKQVLNVHNADMDRESQWTNSLYIYSDRVVIRTFAHQPQTWLPSLDRVVPLPKSDQNQ
jgi:3',5'-cyclic AMP phosphodiesterase CpdA